MKEISVINKVKTKEELFKVMQTIDTKLGTGKYKGSTNFNSVAESYRKANYPEVSALFMLANQVYSKLKVNTKS